MRILWFSNAPWAHTGYANQTALFWHRIQAAGYPVTLAANYGLQGSPLNISEHGQDSRVLPMGMTAHGNDIIASHAVYTKADIVITLYDAWVFDPSVTARFRWVPWAPIDHDPAPRSVTHVLKYAYQAIAYSRFGQDRLAQAEIDAEYIPHGIDTTVFKPTPKTYARKLTKFPAQVDDYDFLAVMVAANKGAPSRKSFGQALYAWKQFVNDGHPNALLYLHTNAGTQQQGVDLEEMCSALGLKPKNVLFADPYWNILGYPDTYMATLYSAADVLLSPSMGEGFGLPIVEAQACGCPVIVGDWTSMPELTFAGWKVKGEPFPTPQGAWQFIPYIGDIRNAIQQAYDAREDKGLRNTARQGALAYDVGRVMDEYWKPVLARLAEQIEATKADPLETVAL